MFPSTKPPLAILLLLVLVAVLTGSVESADLNVYGDALLDCSSSGTALTGFTRNGKCIDEKADTGTHNVCIDMTSTHHGNFCTVTGQPNWCEQDHPCHDDPHANCPIAHWCVCEWAFQGYLNKAGGCDQIGNVVCESTNQKVIMDYQAAIAKGDKDAKVPLDCLREKCNLDI